MLSGLESSLYKLFMVMGANNHKFDLGVPEEGLRCAVVLRLGEINCAMARLGTGIIGAQRRGGALEKGVDREIRVGQNVREVEALG